MSVEVATAPPATRKTNDCARDRGKMHWKNGVAAGKDER